MRLTPFLIAAASLMLLSHGGAYAYVTQENLSANTFAKGLQMNADGSSQQPVANQPVGDELLKGPANVQLADLAVLDLPTHYYFLTKTQYEALQTYILGKEYKTDEGFLGAVGTDRIAVTIDYMSLSHKTEQQIKRFNRISEMAQRLIGFARDDMKILEESEPTYIPSEHATLLTRRVRFLLHTGKKQEFVSVYAMKFGKDGVFIVLANSDPASKAQAEKAAMTVLTAIKINKGHRYEDYVASTWF